MRTLTALTLLLATMTVGCLVFPGGAVAPTSPWPPAPPAAKKSIHLTVSWTRQGHITAGDTPFTMDTPENLLEWWGRNAKATYGDSELFSAIVADGDPSDLRAEGRMTETMEGNLALGLLNLLTLTVLPASRTDHFTLRTEFKDASGKLLGTIEKSDSLDVWFELFLVVAVPFRSSLDREVLELVTNLNRATLASAHAEGII